MSNNNSDLEWWIYAFIAPIITIILIEIIKPDFLNNDMDIIDVIILITLIYLIGKIIIYFINMYK